MPLTDKEKQKNRMKTSKPFQAYLPNFMAIPFREKLNCERKTFSMWLKENVEKYLKKNWKNLLKSIDSIITLCYNIIKLRERGFKKWKKQKNSF